MDGAILCKMDGGKMGDRSMRISGSETQCKIYQLGRYLIPIPRQAQSPQV